MLLKDTSTGYGWVSIALHWVTAIVITVLLYLGNSIAAQIGDARIQALNAHTSLAIAFYILLWARIVWRFFYHHPGPLPKQRGVFHAMGKWAHYVLLIALAIMLVTGPLTAWTAGSPIVVYDWFTIPSPVAQSIEARDLFHSVHRFCAILIFIGILLHLGGVYKHTAFNQDGTLTKIIFPEKSEEPTDAAPEPDLPEET